MIKLHYSIVISAPKEKVWHTMLDDASYRVWTENFAKGSHYKGDWSVGSKIMFLSPYEKGMRGMVSRVSEVRKYDFLSIEHIGFIDNEIEDLTSDKVKSWAGAHENYTLKEVEGGTELSVDMDSVEAYKEMFNKTWPQALQKLKEIAESGKVKTITVACLIKAPLLKVWEYRTKPEHVIHWAFASDAWEVGSAEQDVRSGGRFKVRMQAKDKSAGFDFTGIYTNVKDKELIEYNMDDGRRAKVEFIVVPDGVKVMETFEPESENSLEMQRSGWQAIMDNFKRHVEEGSEENEDA